MYCTGGPELAVDLRIAALKALLAKIVFMFHAFITCFPVRVVSAIAHGCPSNN